MAVEDPELPLHRCSRNAGPVQPALSDRHRASPGEQRVESLEGRAVGRLGKLGEKLGVDAERDLESAVA
jgi:hypothetical protein